MPSFICATGDNMMILFLRKGCISVSTTRAIRMRRRGAKKFGNLNDFKVRDIHKKKLWDKWIRSINSIGTIICPKQEIN
jgi:hypothetical protein